jgi:glutathione S-transferase
VQLASVTLAEQQTEDVLVFLQDAAKRQFADELFASANAFTKALYSPLLSHAAVSDEVGKKTVGHCLDRKDCDLGSLAQLLT